MSKIAMKNTNKSVKFYCNLRHFLLSYRYIFILKLFIQKIYKLNSELKSSKFLIKKEEVNCNHNNTIFTLK